MLPDGASIILNASMVGSKGLPAYSVYSATKAAVPLVRADMDDRLKGAPYSNVPQWRAGTSTLRRWGSDTARRVRLATGPM